MPCYFFFRFRPERHLSPIVAPAAELQMASLDVVGKVFNVYYAARLMPRWGKHPSKMSITGRNRLGQRILVLLLIATCSMGSCWRVWQGLWRLLFVWFFTVLYGRAEFSFARVFKWWALFCNFVNSFCWSSLISCWRLPDHNAVEAQNRFGHQLHFVVPVGTKSKIRNQNNKKYIDDI